MKIAIIGTGLYSLSMAKRLAKNEKNNIVMWTEDNKKEEEFKKTNKIKSIFKDEVFNKNITVTTNLEECVKDAKVIYLMTSTKFLNNTLINLKSLYKKNQLIVIGSKGIDTNSSKFPSQLVKKVLKTTNLSVIAGPSFAVDIVADLPLALTLATKKKSIFNKVKSLYIEDNVTLEFSKDVIGLQLCSTLKNIYAIGCGIISGLGYPSSNNAIYLTKVIRELHEILYCYNSEMFSTFNYGAVGDLLMTCSEEKSRNFTYGVKLTAKTKAAATNYLKKNTVEGLNVLECMYNVLKKKRIKAPIITNIYDIIYNKKDKDTLI